MRASVMHKVRGSFAGTLAHGAVRMWSVGRRVKRAARQQAAQEHRSVPGGARQSVQIRDDLPNTRAVA